MITTLAKLKDGDFAVVKEIRGGHSVHHRLGRLGLHPSDRIRVIRNGFFGGPILIKVHGIEVGIGKGLAEKVEVEAEERR
jgi:ferrous iron transport protein A